MGGASVAIGLDLAWSDRYGTGACALDSEGNLSREKTLGNDDEIIAWVEDAIGDGPAVVAVDAPLQVPNETGRRCCEKQISQQYGGRKAGAHSSNRKLFEANYGRIRGEDLSERLSDLEFGGPWDNSRRTLIEVYPHPALIEVFGLEERLPYKKRKQRVAQWREGLRQLSGHLDSLAEREPPLKAGPLRIDDSVRGRRLKEVEDLLDARFCAWMALLWLARGRDAFTIFGDEPSGHIAVPKPL